jgi:hypothetical protein
MYCCEAKPIVESTTILNIAGNTNINAFSEYSSNGFCGVLKQLYAPLLLS